MKLCRQILIFLVVTAIAAFPLAKTAAAQDAGSQSDPQQITSNDPQVMATAEKQMPAQKKPTGKYILLGVLGVALVALAAGGGGGGGGGGSATPAGDTGTVEVGW